MPPKISTSATGTVLVVGATGFVGGHLARHLAASGRRVVGLARTDAAAARLAADDIDPVRGDLDRLDELLDLTSDLAPALDAVVFAPALDVDREAHVVERMLEHLARPASPTGRTPTFVFLSGTGVLMQRSHGRHGGLTFAEDDPFEPEPLALRRVGTEDLVRSAHDRGPVRGLVLRPPEIWGPGDSSRIESIRRSVTRTGAACYVGEGTNAYSHVTVAGLADLLERALDQAPAGALYHAVDGEVTNGEIATEVGDVLRVAVRSVDEDEAQEIWGPFGALLMAATSSTTSPRARGELGWRPTAVDLRTAVRARLAEHPTA